MISVDTIKLKPNECQEVGRVFQKEVDRRRELDAWNEKYKEEFETKGNNTTDNHLPTYKLQVPTSIQIENVQSPLKPKQMKTQIYNEIFK